MRVQSLRFMISSKRAKSYKVTSSPEKACVKYVVALWFIKCVYTYRTSFDWCGYVEHQLIIVELRGIKEWIKRSRHYRLSSFNNSSGTFSGRSECEPY